MTPNPNAVFAAVPAGAPTTPTPLRLQLDPNKPAEPYLDGAWWPRSTELPDELPALLKALSAHLGPIALIGYRRDGWNPAPDQLDHAGYAVHLEGFVSPGPPTLVVVDKSGRRITMRVVPPETDSAAAAELMAANATHYSGHDDGGAATNADAASTISLDEVATRLARLPGNTDPAQAALISRWVTEAADQFRQAPIQAFVPILVEHIVRRRLYSNRADRPSIVGEEPIR
jgi:hypothetical protein